MLAICALPRVGKTAAFVVGPTCWCVLVDVMVHQGTQNLFLQIYLKGLRSGGLHPSAHIS